MADDGYIWLKSGDIHEKGDEIHIPQTNDWKPIAPRTVGTKYMASVQARRKIKEIEKKVNTKIIVEKLEEPVIEKKSWLEKILFLKKIS